MTTAYIGHIVAVEADDDMGRYWRTFDATDPVTGPAVSAEASAYIARIADAGELSDVDCSGSCPCAQPSPDCAECVTLGVQCTACWREARAIA
jgi:hypothetical protein